MRPRVERSFQDDASLVIFTIWFNESHHRGYVLRLKWSFRSVNLTSKDWNQFLNFPCCFLVQVCTSRSKLFHWELFFQNLICSQQSFLKLFVISSKQVGWNPPILILVILIILICHFTNHIMNMCPKLQSSNAFLYTVSLITFTIFSLCNVFDITCSCTDVIELQY